MSTHRPSCSSTVCPGCSPGENYNQQVRNAPSFTSEQIDRVLHADERQAQLIADLRTALAQAERERDEAREERDNARGLAQARGMASAGLQDMLAARDATVLRLRRVESAARHAVNCGDIGSLATEQLLKEALDALSSSDSGALSRVLGEVASALEQLADDANWNVFSGEEYTRPSGRKGVTWHQWVSELDGRILAGKALAKLKPWLAA